MNQNLTWPDVEELLFKRIAEYLKNRGHQTVVLVSNHHGWGNLATGFPHWTNPHYLLVDGTIWRVSLPIRERDRGKYTAGKVTPSAYLHMTGQSDFAYIHPRDLNYELMYYQELRYSLGLVRNLAAIPIPMSETQYRPLFTTQGYRWDAERVVPFRQFSRAVCKLPDQVMTAVHYGRPCMTALYGRNYWIPNYI